MQAFTVTNITGTFYATVWARNADQACALCWALGAHPRSILRPRQINGHGRPCVPDELTDDDEPPEPVYPEPTGKLLRDYTTDDFNPKMRHWSEQ